jgi:hypothetical protein
MVTANDEATGAGAGVGAGGVDGDGAAGDDELELPHAIVNARRDETTTIRIANIKTSTGFDVPYGAAFHDQHD